MPQPPADSTAAALAPRSGSSLHYALLFQPPAQRAAILALHAVRRAVHGGVSGVSDPQVAAMKLAWWEAEVGRTVREGKPSHPAMQALAPHLAGSGHLAASGITEAPLLAMVESARMDLQQTRYLDRPALERYCLLASGVPGAAVARILGSADSASQPSIEAHAHTLGQALQLTRIIRDVGHDARRGHIYLPLSELRQCGITPADLLLRAPPWAYGERFTALMRLQAQRAHALYEQAHTLLPAPARRAQRPALVMAAIYRTLLREIEASGFAVLHQRVALTPIRKLWIALRTR